MPKNIASNASSQIAQTQKIRRKQIEKLKQLKLTVSVIHRDVQYRVDFLLKQENKAYSIVIDLPPAFPSEAPMLFIHPPCSHKYLDAAQLVINFPPLENFKSKPDIAHVVKRLISEFEKNPPIPLIYPEYQFEGDRNSFTTHSYHPEYRTHEESSPSETATTSSYNGPKLPEVLPDLEEVPTDELREMLSDEVLLLGVFQKTEMAKKIQDEREEMSQRIEEIAAENLSYSEQLENSRRSLVDSFDKCRSLKDDYDKKMEKYMESSEWLSLNNLSLTLQVSAAEKEEDAEKIAEKFLEGEIDVGDFTKEFVKAKSLATTRKVQEDKIRHLIVSSS